MIEHVLHTEYLDRETMPPGGDLVAEVRALNDAGVEIPWCWKLSREPVEADNQDRVTLTFGVNNDVGVVKWTRGATSHVPTAGTNTEWLTYYLAGFHDFAIPPHAEVPVETVYAAVTEFLSTWQPPTCVQWREAASVLSRFT